MEKCVRGAACAWVVALILGSGACLANPLKIPEPGYLVIDDAWYGFGVSNTGQPGLATLSPLSTLGFHLQTAFELGNCQRGSGLSPSAVETGQSAFSVSSLPVTQLTEPTIGSPPLRPLADTTPASVQLASCQGVVIVFAHSVDGDLSCDMRLRFPFQKRGVCPQLDAADQSYVFYADFD